MLQLCCMPANQHLCGGATATSTSVPSYAFDPGIKQLQKAESSLFLLAVRLLRSMTSALYSLMEERVAEEAVESQQDPSMASHLCLVT